MDTLIIIGLTLVLSKAYIMWFYKYDPKNPLCDLVINEIAVGVGCLVAAGIWKIIT